MGLVTGNSAMILFDVSGTWCPYLVRRIQLVVIVDTEAIELNNTFPSFNFQQPQSANTTEEKLSANLQISGGSMFQ
jgi:hypothetical protein